MIPLLLLLSLNAASSSGNTDIHYIVAFPENIAYYHPSTAQNLIYVTALNDDTDVDMNSDVHEYRKHDNMHSGRTEAWSFNENVELQKSDESNRLFKVKSDKKIAISVVSAKNGSVQTALIIPNDKLGQKYFIPPVPNIPKTTTNVTLEVTERQPFKLIILNTDKENKVAIEGSSNVSLAASKVAHVFLTSSTGNVVTSEHPVAVIFGHTCAIRQDCTCGLLYAMLPPANDEPLKYYIPTVVTKDVENDTYILLSDEGSTRQQKFNPGDPQVQTAGTAILYQPGLLLNLIPETDFATCFFIRAISDNGNFPDFNNYAVIVVHKDKTEGVHIGESPVESADWKPLTSTDYVSAKVKLQGSTKYVVWHPSSKMAVYFMGDKDDTLFGNPATVLSTVADYRGCVLTPEVIEIGDAKTWQDSVGYCEHQSTTKSLLSLSTNELQAHIFSKINQETYPDHQAVWIGMRRSALSGQHYWLNKDKANETNWDDGEPGAVEEGQCTVMSVESGKWSDEDCCVKVPPVCYTPPVLFPLT